MLTIPIIRLLPELSDGIVVRVNIDDIPNSFQMHSDDYNDRSARSITRQF